MDANSLEDSTKYKFWALLTIAVGVHVTAFLPWHKLPHADLFFVMHVINAVWQPELFGANWLTEFLMSFHTRTAPIYYYGFAYPLRFLMPAKWVILTLGVGATLVSAYVAGRPWTRWKHALVATFLTLVLLAVSVSPLEGNKRSFTAVFVILALGTGSQARYLYYLVLTALAAGIYAPVGLVLIAFYAVGCLDRYWRGRNTLLRAGIRVSGLCGVFWAVLTPYWIRIVLGEGGTYVTSFVDATAYTLTSFEGLVQTFLIGSRGTHYGALFMQQQHFDLFLVVALLCGLQYLLLGSDFEFPRRYGYMILAVLGLWCLAHLLFPLIYFPFKYTRLALPVTLAFPAVRNLPAAVTRLRDRLHSRPGVRFILYGSGLGCLVTLGVHKLGLREVRFLESGPLLGTDARAFLLLLPALLGITVLVPKQSDQPRVLSLLVVLLVAGVIFLPRSNPRFAYRGAHLSVLEGLFDVLETSPPGSRIAGPPDLMVPVIGFGKRAVYNSPDWRTNDVLCRRNEAYWKVLFASDPATVRKFMRSNELRFFLVDRQLLKRRNVFGTKGCVQQFRSIDVSNPYLARPFPGATWHSDDGRFVLITPDVLPSS